MKTIKTIPISKIKRTSKLLTTGAKVGTNYLKYHVDKLVNSEEKAKERLNESNAETIYSSLKTLKGSALKVAQMLSMEKNILPQAYVEKFSLSQFSVPPLSPPLVIKMFQKYFNKHPSEVFDTFNVNAINAASIGQVHQAEKEGKIFAVKIQYPGVAKSISSDLALVRPIATKMFKIKGKDSDKYFKEVENKLIEETDYKLELKQSKAVAEACKHIPNLNFPKYYENLSSERIITMDWMEGKHLSEFENNSPEVATKIGQALWDFYMYQIHRLKKVHADPHPGNFLVSDKNELIALDFGCMKTIPMTFYTPYFELTKQETISNPIIFEQKLFELEILRQDDSKEELDFLKDMFHQIFSLFSKPFHFEFFDFSDEFFFQKLSELGAKYSKNSALKKMNGNRGAKHFIYINRTFFGLYSLMHDLKANNIKINV